MIDSLGGDAPDVGDLETITGGEKIPVETADGNGHVTTEQIKEYAQPDLSDYATKAEIEGIGGVGKPGEGKDAEIFNNYTNNQATGKWSHAEGCETIADGDYSHAEGRSTTASGACSHAEGAYTQAQNDVEHAEGFYNKSNATTRHSVGIGTSDNDRKNAFEIMANGDIYVYGLGGYDGTNALSADSKTLQQMITELQGA